MMIYMYSLTLAGNTGNHSNDLCGGGVKSMVPVCVHDGGKYKMINQKLNKILKNIIE